MARDAGDTDKVDALDREPIGKVPLSAVAMERKGTPTERGEEQRGVQARNQARRALAQQLREVSARIAETMRELGGKAKDAARDMAQGLRARLGAAWSSQDRAADHGAAERIAEATAQRVEPARDTPEPGSAAERIASRVEQSSRPKPPVRQRQRDKDRGRTR